MIPCFFYPEYLRKRGRWNKFDEHLFLTRCFNHLDSRLCWCFFATGISVLPCRTTKNCCPLAPTISRWGWLRTWDWWALMEASCCVCTLHSIFLHDFWKCYIKTLCLSVFLFVNAWVQIQWKSLTSSKIIKHNNCTRVYIHTSLRFRKIWSSSSRLIRWVKLGDAEKPPDLKVRWRVHHPTRSS